VIFISYQPLTTSSVGASCARDPFLIFTEFSATSIFYFFSNYASFLRKIVSLMTEGHLCAVYSKVEKYIDLLDGSSPVGPAGADCILALQRQSKWEIH